MALNSQANVNQHLLLESAVAEEVGVKGQTRNSMVAEKLVTQLGQVRLN